MKRAIWICALLPMMAFAGCSAESDPLGINQEALTSGLSIRRGVGTVADSTINAQDMKKNYGAKDKLIVSKKNESLLRFDVAAIPGNAIVNSATLTLYQHGREDGDDHDDDDDDRDEDCRGFSSVPIHIHRATAAWTESKVTYANFNQRFEAAVAGILLPTGSNTYKSIDLKATVQAWVNGSRPNHGLVLRTTSRKRWGFASSENGRASLRPSLSIVYSTPDEHCQPNPCENGGVCANGWTGYTCTCAPGYSGPSCQTNINDCAGNPCQNGGTCTDGVVSYTCACAPGYTGANCQTNIDDCAGSPCQNGGVCTDGVNSYSCACAPGYTGPSCETNINDCAGNPCQNDGVCSDGIGSYSCACAPGFSGTNCEINIDDCAGSPCQNGGSCVDGVNSYTCNCAVGYEGASCELNINDCAGSPCQNGGSCVDGVGSYTCSCAVGYTGQNCEINIDDCAAHPCQNGGLCVDGVNSYTCSCTSGYTGQNCEQAGCPSDSSAFGGKCYQPFFSRPPVSGSPFNYWFWADADCASRFAGGRLVSIGSAAENQFVRSLISNSGIMFGFADIGRAVNNFAWLDGSPITYTNWAPGEPNNRAVNRFGFILTEDMGMMNPDGTWNDLPYTDGGPYICKFPQ